MSMTRKQRTRRKRRKTGEIVKIVPKRDRQKAAQRGALEQREVERVHRRDVRKYASWGSRSPYYRSGGL